MEKDSSLQIDLTPPMQAYVSGQIKAGLYVDSGEVVRAGVRLLMEHDGAKQFHELKTSLLDSAHEVEAGAFTDFDAEAYEPKAFIK